MIELVFDPDKLLGGGEETYLWTDGRMMMHSSSAFMKPSMVSYLYWLKRTFWPMLAMSMQIGGSLMTIWKRISPILAMKVSINFVVEASPSAIDKVS